MAAAAAVSSSWLSPAWTAAPGWFVPPSAFGAFFLGLVAVAAAAMILLRHRISRRWIDLRRTTTTTGTSTSNNYQNKTAIITGGNTGLGYHVAYDLAVRRRFGTVVLGCRDVRKGRAAAEEIARAAAAAHHSHPSTKESASASPTRVECIRLDLASLSSVAQFAEAVKSKYSNIQAVVLNAGVWVPMDRRWKTDDGYEIHFGVNHLAHQLLAQLLLPHLQQQQQPGVSSSRIVWVASSLLKYGEVRVDGTNDFVRTGRQQAGAVATGSATKNRSSARSKADQPAAAGDQEGAASEAARPSKKAPSFAPTGYCDSKLMNALACRHLAATTELSVPSTNIKGTRTAVATYAVCPGFCRTDLGRNSAFSWWKKLLLRPLLWMIQRPADVGAQNIVYLCLEDATRLVNGGLYRDGQVMREDGCTDLVDRLVGDGTADKLWDLCSSLLKDYLK